MKHSFPLFKSLAASVLAASSLLAQSTSTSASYTLLHAPAGSASGGGQVTNGGGTIVAQTSVGDAIGGGVSNVTSGGVQMKNNYIGQLYDVTAVEVAAAPTTINEGGTRQLTTTVELDDATFLALDADAFSWGYDPGIASIDASTGIATADVVFENTATAVSAELGGVTSPDLPLTILDIDPDNYQGYGADGIEDGWQVSYYGEPPNADAAPGIDFDQDGDDNEKEFLFGFSPLDPNDFFQMTITTDADPSTVDLVLNRVIPNRTYTLQSGTDLISYPVDAVPPFSVAVEETDKALDDVPAPTGASFLTMEATRP